MGSLEQSKVLVVDAVLAATATGRFLGAAFGAGLEVDTFLVGAAFGVDLTVAAAFDLLFFGLTAVLSFFVVVVAAFLVAVLAVCCRMTCQTLPSPSCCNNQSLVLPE